MGKVTVAYAVSNALRWYQSANDEWKPVAYEQLRTICRQHLPHGAGIDLTKPEALCGLQIDCEPERLIVRFEFHHMNDVGMYDGWTSHSAAITPAFSGVNVRIAGRDRNEIKDYLHDVYREAFTTLIEEPFVDAAPGNAVSDELSDMGREDF